jgi:hypothetical protein
MKHILMMPIVTPGVIWVLVALTFWLGGPPPEGWAMLAPALSTEADPAAEAGRLADLRIVQHTLESKIIQQRLLDWGLTADEVQARLAALSDQEVHQLAMHLDALTPGGNGLEILIVLLVIAIVVVLVIYLMGHKIVIQKDGAVEKK